MNPAFGNSHLVSPQSQLSASSFHHPSPISASTSHHLHFLKRYFDSLAGQSLGKRQMAPDAEALEDELTTEKK
jgi:hypothetical protein